VTTNLTHGDHITTTITRPAHGGVGIGDLDGRVVFVRGTYPGDVVEACITQVKKNYAKATLVDIVTPSPLRVPNRCPAAAHGAGCCDFADLKLEAELELKTTILTGQLTKLGKLAALPPITAQELPPTTGWRSRIRLGVDRAGRAGFRKAHSHDLVTDHRCIQPMPGLLGDGPDSIVGADSKYRFTPGAEVIAVLDDDGTRHVVEVRKPARGRRSEIITKVISGTGDVVQKVGEYTFTLPPTAFWQAHHQALSTYSDLITQWVTGGQYGVEPVGWDLYGGVGALVPALHHALGNNSHIHSVESARIMATSGQVTFGDDVHFHIGLVGNLVDTLPQPDVVVLDPPRVGAGADVVTRIAARKPQRVIHIGCDPATFATDIRAWSQAGYHLSDIVVVNAFPGTHHFETLGLLQP